MAASPQRFLPNNRNLIAAAILTPSAVQAVEHSVIETPVARSGTAQLKVTGSYTGFDDATYDLRITDADASGEKLVSAPVANIAGSESLTDIVATSVAPQTFVLECHSPGIPAKAAAVDIGGVSIVARAPGTSGNNIRVSVDTSGLTYATVLGSTSYSLIGDVAKGSGSEDAPLKGSEFDYGTATVGADGVIPTSAQRIAFEGDRSNVYVQFKKYVDGEWQYFFVPSLLNDYPAGTRVLFVGGSYAVTITDGATPEVLSSIVTVYDFLNKVKTTSVLCDVDGVIANDRTATGQAAREFPVRTDARAGISTGAGSKAAKGFADVVVDPAASTELITATCVAIDTRLDPLAYVGHEAWDLEGSSSGDLGRVYTGETIDAPTFSAVIPQRLPSTTIGDAGKFTLTSVDMPRDTGSIAPDVCFFGKLGPNAVDQTITLTYKRKRVDTCNCESMPIPELDGPCLGTEGDGGDDVTWSSEAQTRANDLYDWSRDLVGAVSSYVLGSDLQPMVEDGDPSVTAGVETVNLTVGRGPVSYTSSFAAAVGPTRNALVQSAPVDTGWADVAIPSDFFDLLEYYLDGLEAIDAISDTTLRAAGFTAWDEALAAWEGDLATSALSTLGNRLATLATVKYQTLVRRAAAAAGVRLKKANASAVVSGDGCWQDFGGDFFWEVVGSEGGGYAPLFTNHAYWSSQLREINGDKAYFATKEFALIINIACVQYLVEGDKITLTIGNAGSIGTYQVDDVLKLPIIAAADLFLTGGVDASLVQSWYVTGSVDGAFAVYTFDPDAPAAYSDGGISFLLVMGGIDPSAGDSFTFVVEGAHFEWRVNGGSWTSEAPVEDGPMFIDEGLSVELVRGASPSFVTDDTFTFRALQQWTAENVKSPTRPRFFAGTTTWTLEALFDAVSPIDAIALALHTIPEGSTISVDGGNVAGVPDWNEVLTWQRGPIAKFVDREATWVRLNVTEAGSPAVGAVGYFFAGAAFSTELTADVQLRRNYRLERGSGGGLYQGGAFLGKAINATVEWSPGSLSEDDADGISEMLDHVKENDDEPLVFVPNITRPADALIATVVEDEVEIEDVHSYQPNADFDRKLSARMTLQGVWT